MEFYYFPESALELLSSLDLERSFKYPDYYILVNSNSANSYKRLDCSKENTLQYPVPGASGNRSNAPHK